MHAIRSNWSCVALLFALSNKADATLLAGTEVSMKPVRRRKRV